MSVTAIFEAKTEPERRAAAALAAAREHDQRLAAKDADWTTRESAERAIVRDHDAARQALEALEQKRIDAIADAEVLGRSDCDAVAIAREIGGARLHVAALAEKAKLAQAKLARIETQRSNVRHERTAHLSKIVDLAHAAAVEELTSLVPELKRTESEYIGILIKVFGLVGVCNKIAAQRPGLGRIGGVNVNDLFFPRPGHPAFASDPAAAQDSIYKRILAETELAEKAL